MSNVGCERLMKNFLGTLEDDKLKLVPHCKPKWGMLQLAEEFFRNR